jgi:methionyl aminopeptidase
MAASDCQMGDGLYPASWSTGPKLPYTNTQLMRGGYNSVQPSFVASETLGLRPVLRGAFRTAPRRPRSAASPVYQLAAAAGGGQRRQERPSPSSYGKGAGASSKKGKDEKKTVQQFTRGQGFAKTASTKSTRTLLRPGVQSPPRTVPSHIPRPKYAAGDIPARSQRLLPRMPWDIEVKTPEQIERMRKAGRIAREVLDAACKAVHVGMTTDEIDAIVHEETIRRNAYPSPLHYNGFPKSCCTSINEVICHGIPDSTRLRDGDIINIDVTCYVEGVHGDCSEMVLVGNVDKRGRELVRVTFECLEKAISICSPGAEYSMIGAVIEDLATQHGFGVARDFFGHGIGEEFHDNPNILHFRNREPYGRMKVGHTFTIEPMLHETMNTRYRVWSDGWTAVTEDGGRSAQYEHTLLIVEDGVEILTRKTSDSFPYFWETEAAADAPRESDS